MKARSGCEWCPDVLSIERLAAKAEAGGKRTSELEGAGVTRIDIYWQSRTVCTCRIQTARQARTTATTPATRRDTPDFGPRYGKFRSSPLGFNHCHAISRRGCDSVTLSDLTVSTSRGNEGACNFARGDCCICVFIIVAWIRQKKRWGRLGCHQGSGRGLGFVDTVWPSTVRFFRKSRLSFF